MSVYKPTKEKALSALKFARQGHRYTVSGMVIPSVTQVIDEQMPYENIPHDVREDAKLRGDLVHRMTARLDNGLSADEAGEVGLGGYIEAWKRFKLERGLLIEGIEERVYNRKHRYAGTVDRICRLLIPDNLLSVLDIKSGIPQPESAWQTAAYLAAANEDRLGERVVNRYLLYLASDGRYNLVKNEEKADMDAFLAALTIKLWRLRFSKRGTNK